MACLCLYEFSYIRLHRRIVFRYCPATTNRSRFFCRNVPYMDIRFSGLSILYCRGIDQHKHHLTVCVGIEQGSPARRESEGDIPARGASKDSSLPARSASKGSRVSVLGVSPCNGRRTAGVCDGERGKNGEGRPVDDLGYWCIMILWGYGNAKGGCIMRLLPTLVYASLFLSITIGMSPVWAGNPENERAEAYEEIYHRMNRLGQEKNLVALEAIAQEIEQRWGKTDIEMYASCMHKLSCELGSREFKEMNKARGLSQTLAMKALEKSDQIPLDLMCQLVQTVQPYYDAGGKKLEGQDFARLRREQMRLWLHAWQRIEKTIDKNWNPDDMPSINVPPPPGVPGMAGMSPDGIKDPQQRAQYVAAIEANRKKAERCNEQMTARRLKEHWVKWAQRHIFYVYMEPPDAKDELKQLLDEYGIDAETSTILLDAIEKKEMPKHLEIINTTQPATRPE